MHLFKAGSHDQWAQDNWIPLLKWESTHPSGSGSEDNETFRGRIAERKTQILTCFTQVTITGFKALVFVIAWFTVFQQLSPPVSLNAIVLPLYGRVSSSVIPYWLPALIYCAWILIGLVLPALALTIRQGPKKVLLIVDDLDRCDSDQMLEIVESIVMFLDDPDIRSRLEIAMLVEEESLAKAIERKYAHLWKGDTDNAETQLIDRIVSENVEKLFLAHLRLPELNKEDRMDMWDRFLPTDSKIAAPRVTSKKKTQTAEQVGDKISDSSVTVDSKGDNAAADSQVSAVVNKQKVELKELISLSDDEKSQIKLQLEHYGEESRRWGPRAARCFIHKYQLARAISVAIDPNNPPEPAEMVAELLNPEKGDAQTLVQKAVQQVS